MLRTALENLPHREPFRFISIIDELEIGRRGAGRWAIGGDEDFFVGHFPGNPLLPGVLIAESLAQLSGLVAFSGDCDGKTKTARLAHVDVKFQASVSPPAEVRLESTLTREMSGLYLFQVRAEVRSVAVAVGSLVLARVM